MLPCSSAAKKDLMHYYHINESKAIVFPNALQDTEQRNKSHNKKIGFLGRLHRSKGVDILIDAFVKLLKEIPDAVLEIAGSGTDKPELERIAYSAIAAKSIIFKGNLPYSEVLPFLSSLNFLVVPSRSDNLPTVVLEAFSAGTPVIGSNAGGIPDMIIDGYNGLLFEKENADDLLQHMMLLLTNNEQRDSIAVNARKTFEEKYCINNLPERFEALLENRMEINNKPQASKRSQVTNSNKHQLSN